MYKHTFDFHELYENVVANATNGDTFVELSNSSGESTKYMASLIKRSGKDIKFYSVNTWESFDTSYPMDLVAEALNLPWHHALYLLFLRNLKEDGLLQFVKTMRMEEVLANKLFENNEISFLMIDGNHDFVTTKESIELWRDKMRNDGLMAGHGYDMIGDLLENCLEDFSKEGQCWLSKKSDL